ncbi:hypothetical protein BGX34_000760 [Mortierella sp. NVP85]|nr:hypothetical protein BGX34_000760 [Mortierella sp. NVP85]
MDSFLQAGHPSLAAFPLGLGLTAAAHIHLCQRTLHKATLKHDYCVQRQSSLNPDQFALTIAESMNQMVALVDDIILRFQDSLPRPRRRHDSGKTHSRRTRDRRNSLVTPKRTTTARFRDSRRVSEDNLPIFWTHSTPLSTKDVKGKGIATTVLEEETAHQEGLLYTMPEESQEAEGSGLKRPKTARPPRQAGESFRRKPTAVHVSVESLETWSNTYRTLRRIQERHSKNVFQRLIKSDPVFVKLQGNALFMFFLGGITTLRHLITTTGFKSLVAKCSWIPGFEWFTWANISPPRSSYIPWGLAQRSGKHVGTGGGTSGGTADVTAVAAAGRGGPNNSNVSTAFAFLPLVPTLLVAGMHFVAALRTQWNIRQIEKENRRQTQYARQLGVMAMFLLIREQRLGWLAEKIRDFEEEEATKSRETKGGGGGDDNDEDFEDVPDEEEAETHGPNMADTAAFINSLQHHEAVREDYHNNTDMEGQEDGSSPPRRGRIQLVDPKVLVLTFGPNLEKMDMQQFLMNPMERNRILRLEFEGMRDELVLFRQNMIHAGQVVH